MADLGIPREIPLRVLELPTASTKAVLAAMVGIGAVAFVVTLFVDADRAWRSYLASWLWATSVAQGAVILAVVTTITRAKWAWSVRRIASAYAAFLPISFLLLLPLLIGSASFLPWVEMMASDPIVQGKAAWLNIPFLVVRNVVGLALLFGLSLYFVYLGLRPDLGLAKTNGGVGRPLHERWTRDWRGQETEEVRSHQVLARLGPVIVLAFALILTLVAFDWIMALEPHWFSTLLGGWFFMGGFWGGVAATALACLFVRRSAELRPLIGTQQLHDLGKLSFGFAVFWAYLFWSQYLVIWYGKLPSEQSFVITRSLPPWNWLSLVVLLLCFVVPFAGLLGKKPKITPVTLGLFCSVILFGLWCERLLLVAPPLYHGAGAPVALVEPLVGIGFLGLVIASVRWFLSNFPVIQVWQPLVEAEAVEVPTAATHRP